MEEEGVVHQSSDSDDVRLQKLLAWAESRHIWIHDDIQIMKMPQPTSASPPVQTNRQTPEGASAEGNNMAGSGSQKGADKSSDTAESSGFGVYVKEGKVILERQVGE